MTVRLIKAAANNNFALAVQYIRAGDNIDSQENLYGQTALHCALKCGHNNIVNLLLYFGANPNIQDDMGFTANDIYNGTYHQYMDNLFMTKLEEQSDLLGSDYNYLNDNFSSDYY